MSSNMIQLFEKLKAFDNPEMLQIISEAEYSLNNEFFPQFMVVSHPSSRKELIGIWNNMMDAPYGELDGLVRMDGDFSVCFKYGEDRNGQKPDAVDINGMITVNIPWDMLRKADLIWMCVSSLEKIPRKFIANADKILLVTNAAMAMTQEEKKWLSEVTRSIFGEELITISLYNKDVLNTQEDLELLRSNLNNLVTKIGGNTVFIDDISEAAGRLFEDVDSQDLWCKRQNRTARVCLDELEKYIKGQLELAEVDMDKMNESVRKMEAERKNIEFSSKLVINSTINNMYDEMRDRMLTAAEQYSNDAYESIREALSTSKNIEKDINNIAPYLKYIWEHFEKEIVKHMVSEQEKIAGILEQQIFEDCKKMVDLLEVDTTEQMMDIPPLTQIHNIPYEMDESKAKKDKMISKGMLMTSIALAFVNPLWGLAGVVGTSVFNLSNIKNMDEAKNRVLCALPNECNTAKRDVENQMELTIEKSKKESCENVGKIYSEVLDHLLTEIFSYVEQMKLAKEKAEAFRDILENGIPEAKKDLR